MPAVPRPVTPEEFADWVRPNLPAMARLAARLGPPDERDDIVQEALTRAWAKLAQFDPARGTATAWLLAITADRARRARRRRVPSRFSIRAAESGRSVAYLVAHVDAGWRIWIAH